MKETNLEVKVGFFVLVSLALLAGLFFHLDLFRMESRYPIRVIFNDAGGLEVGAQVQLAGVPVGSVDSVHIRKSEDGITYVGVVAMIEKGVVIERNTEANISPGGLLGQRYLQMFPGAEQSAPLKPGDVLKGRDPMTIEAVARTGSRMVNKLEMSVDYLNHLIGDDEFRKHMKNNVVQLSGMLEDLKETTHSLKVVLARLENGEGTIGKLLTEETVYEDVSDLVSDLKANPWKLLKKTKEKKRSRAR